MRPNLYSRLLALATLLACQALPIRLSAQEAEASPTNWLNPDGKAVAAEFVRLTDSGVILRLSTNGKEVPVAFTSLSLESHLQALKLANPEAFSKPLIKTPEKVVVEDYQGEPLFAAAEVLTSPFSQSTTVEQFLDTVISELKRGNSFVAWHSLPPKMQNDTEDLMVKAVGALGKQPIGQVRALLKSLSVVVHEKSQFIRAYPAVAAQPEAIEFMDKNLPKIAGMMTQLSEESRWQVENFQKGKILPWLADFAADLSPYALDSGDSLNSIAAQDFDITYKIISQSADRAQVEFTATGLPPNVPPIPQTPLDLQKVGDIWLVPSAMNEMRGGIDAATKALDSNPKVAAGLPFFMVPIVAAVGSLERAETQAEFNAAMDAILALFQNMPPPQNPGGQMANSPNPSNSPMQGGGLLGPATPAAAPPTSPGGRPGRLPMGEGAGT